MNLRLFSLFLLLFAPLRLLAAGFLFADGRSDYSIVLPADASTSERMAAQELQQYILRMSGVRLPVVGGAHAEVPDSLQRQHIFVGWNESCGRPRPAGDDESFTYCTVGSDLHIFGGSERGTMYGVFTFLERELGVRWLTSSCTTVPQRERYGLPLLDYSERPAFRHRLDFCYDALRHRDWMAHNRLNDLHHLVTNRYGSFSAIWGMHTFHKLIPPDRYFSAHPEYFSLVEGRRSDKAQLCLSNDSLRRELTANLLAVIRDNPGYWCYDVSQNDNRLDCECTACMTLTRRCGGRSGALLWFVGQVADEVAREFPDVCVSTFAYHTTRTPPPAGSVSIPANVVIRLCPIECCMAHPLDECPENSSFLDDLNAWSALTPNVYVWDYACCFYHYLLPFPNFRALAANCRLFARKGVIGVMEEGAHDAPWSEFSELKQWMIGRLLWNPRQDTDSLAALFIDGYYGEAAPFVLQYYHLCQERASAHHLTLKTKPADPIYGVDFIPAARRLLDQALCAADGDEQMLQRTKRVAAQVYYLQLQRDPKRAKAEGTVQKLKEIVRSDSTIVRESGYTLQTVLDQLGL